MSSNKWPKKCRTFAFTAFDLSTDYESLVTGGQVAYVAYGLESCPTTLREHHQGWVHFVNPQGTSPKVLQKIGAMLGKAHVEPCLGSMTQNHAYISKEGKLTEFGKKPAQGSRGDLKDVVDAIAAGKRTVDDLIMEDPLFFHEYGRTLMKAEDVALRKRVRTEMTRGVWYWGPTGVGKSHKAMEGFTPETHYIKPLEDQWWDGYTGQGTVILNDYRGQLKYSELLTLVDKWPHSVKRRGREPAPFLAHTVIVTSALPPHDVYGNVATGRDSISQLERRFQIVELVAHPKAIFRSKLEQKWSEGNTNTSDPKIEGPKKVEDFPNCGTRCRTRFDTLYD